MQYMKSNTQAGLANGSPERVGDGAFGITMGFGVLDRNWQACNRVGGIDHFIYLCVIAF
jgi:hypothetical protein